MCSKKILLSFDLEEFDIPLEYQQPIDPAAQLSVSIEGLVPLLDLLAHLQIPATFFVTAYFAQSHPSLIQEISARHEVASHGFYHSAFHESDLLLSKQVLEQITGQQVVGFRMARLAPVRAAAVAGAGYSYNASLNPTFLPGRYNHLMKPRTVFEQEGLVQVPSSVTPLVRFPLFWLSFKNLPLWLIQKMSLRTLKHDGYLSLYYHPWEYANLKAYHLPAYVKRLHGNSLLLKLSCYLQFLQQQGTFVTMRDFAVQKEWWTNKV